jgi:ribonuclease HI
MKVYYAVNKGFIPGIYFTWPECEKQIKGFNNPAFKKFFNEKEANQFLKNGFSNNRKPTKEVVDKKNEDFIEKELENNLEEKVFIYTDGSCIRFKNKLCKGGYGIYIPEKNIKIGKPLLNQKVTNNRAELTAIIESIPVLDSWDLQKKLCIFTDSQYSKYIFDGTGERYEKNGYKDKDGKDVPNIDLIKKMLNLKRTYNIVLLKVRAHTDKQDRHSLCNEIADQLATQGANLCDENIFIGKEDEDDKYQRRGKEDEKKINKNITMNELFGFDSNYTYDSDEEIIEDSKKTNIKLSNWFIKK